MLGDEQAAAVCDYYDITEPGNFADEGTRRSIPNRIAHRGDWDRPPELEAARQALFQARSLRPPPALDDKVLTEWNALMISSLAEAGALFGHEDWIDAAARAARFLIAELRDDRGRWRRAWHAAGEPKANHAALGRRPCCVGRRVHAAGRGDRPGVVDHRGDRDRGHHARPLLGSGRGRPVHDTRRWRAADRPPEGPLRQRHPVGQFNRRGRVCTGWPRSPGRPATRTTPIASCG